MPSGNELPPTAGLPLHFRDFVKTPSRSFVQGLRDIFNLPNPIITCSGTAAMVVALHTLKERQPTRTDVIIPAYTCPLVPLAVQLNRGLRAIPCDTRPDSIDLDPGKLSSLCSSRTLAVVPTHLGGRVADVATVRTIADQYGVAVLEDGAQALGAQSNDETVGLAGDVTFFSLAAGKGLSTYEGGILCARDPDLQAGLAATAGRLLPSRPLWSIRRNLELLGYAAFYTPSRLGLVYGRPLRHRLDNGDETAAVGDHFTLADIPLHALDGFRRRVAANALERLPEFLENGRVRAERRQPALRALEGVHILDDMPGAKGVWPFFMVLMPNRHTRDRALGRLWTAGLGVTKLFVHALPDYPYLASCFTSGRSDCPNARDMADRMLTISNTHWLSDDDFTHIVNTLGESL